MRRISALPRALACAAVLCAAPAGIAATDPPAKPAPGATSKSTGHTPTRAAPASPTSKQGTVRGRPGTAAGAKAAAPKAKPKQKPGDVWDIDWRELLPENERAQYSATAPPPQHGRLGEGGPPAPQKQTTTFNSDVADLVVRLPGFVVPLGVPRDGMVNEFFLVPYIGACIHVPPPPPNQMVYVTSASGIAADAIHEAYWVTGKMRVENRTTSLGTAAYAVTASKVELYGY